MFKRLFARRDPAAEKAADALYEQIVAAARQPVLYSDMDVPDTPLGRFEMVTLHMILFLRRVRGEDGAMKNVAQKLTDTFFGELDHSIRELGVGDPSVPKRMKKLGKMFYGRAASYGEALDKGDRASLSAALARNIRPDVSNWPMADALAGYVAAAAIALDDQPVVSLAEGKVYFADAGVGIPS